MTMGCRSCGGGKRKAPGTLAAIGWDAYASDPARIHPSGANGEDAYLASGLTAAVEVANIAPPDDYPRLIDFGCGDGRVTAAFCDLGYSTWAVDAGPQMVARAAGRAPCATPIVSDGRDLASFVGPVDVVVALAVLIHVPYATGRRIVSELSRCLRSGGLLLVDIPIYEERRNPVDWNDVGTWTVADLSIAADRSSLIVERDPHVEPGAFSYDRAPSPETLQILRRA